MSDILEWKDLATPEELRILQNAAARIKEASETIAWNHRLIHSFAVTLAMRCAKSLKDQQDAALEQERPAPPAPGEPPALPGPGENAP